MKKSLIILLHFGYWSVYLLLLTVIFAILTIQMRKTSISLTNFFPLVSLCIFPNLISFYISYFFLFPRFLQRRKTKTLLISGFVVALLTTVLTLVFSISFFGVNQPVFSDSKEFLPMFASFFFVAILHSGIALIIRGFITWFEEAKLKEELIRKNYETEISLIKSQINPHFLFNTINNIDVLITKDSKKASVYLNKLSDILRYMVYEAKNEKILLTKELEYIEKYLKLQEIRTANPNYVSFEIVGEPNIKQIAPMIFFPFIENAFKHTENNKNQNSISIKIFIEKTSINFECKNTYQNRTMQKQEYGGFGNELIQKRLQLLYSENHTLEINDSDGIYEVKLLLKI